MSSSPFASANVSHTPSFDQNQDSQNFDDFQIDLQTLDMDEESESDDIFDTMQQEFAEAHQTLKTIRDFIRFGVSKLREHDVVVAQGTTDEFAEASAIVLQTLSLDWSADEQILDCRLTNSEKSEVLTLLQRRIVERKPLSYLINLSYFCDLPFYVDERVLIPRSPIAELIRQQFHRQGGSNDTGRCRQNHVGIDSQRFCGKSRHRRVIVLAPLPVSGIGISGIDNNRTNKRRFLE